MLEVASQTTGTADYTDKRLDYERVGVLECWRFDPGGGAYHDAALAGGRLAEACTSSLTSKGWVKVVYVDTASHLRCTCLGAGGRGCCGSSILGLRATCGRTTMIETVVWQPRLVPGKSELAGRLPRLLLTPRGLAWRSLRSSTDLFAVCRTLTTIDGL